MKSNIRIKNALNILSEMENESKFQILEYVSLKGATDFKSAIGIKHLRDSGVTLKQVRILLNDSAVKMQVGALSYMKGDITIKNVVAGPVGLGKRLFAKKVTGDNIIKPIFEGSGEIFLEPSFEHFTLIELFDEELILDDGLFYACEEDVEVTISMKKNVSSIVFGDNGLFEVKLKGSGVVVLKIPVPENEVVRCKLFNERLAVDGDFAILRSASINFSVEKSGNSLVGSVLNGEGLLNVYEGVGEVWLLPTKNIYEEIKEYNLEDDIDEFIEEDDN
jgi:uncharacterized protein (AIM24 family)